LYKVRGVQQSGELNGHGDVESEDGEVVVDVVKHAVGGVDLRVELTNHTCEQNHGNTSDQEDVENNLREAPKSSSGKGSTRQVDHEHNQDNHELTSEKVTIEVVSLMAKRSAFVGKRVRFFVQFLVDWGKTDHGGLASLHHGEPDDGKPHDKESEPGVDVRCERGVTGEDKTANNYNGEDKKTCRIEILDHG